MSVVLNDTILSTNPGEHAVLAVGMRYRRIIQVSREGKIFDLIHSLSFFPITPADGARQVCYYAPLGQFIFPADATFSLGETLNVKWR